MKEILIERLENLLVATDAESHKAEFREILENYRQQVYEEQNKKLETETTTTDEETGDTANFVERDPLDDRFYGLVGNFKEKLQAEKELKRSLELKKLDEKKKVIAELQTAVAAQGEIGEEFQRLRKFREDWKNIGVVHVPEYGEVVSEYNHLMDLFYHNISINKDLRDLDYQKNLEAKNELIGQLDALAEQEHENVKALETDLKKLQSDFNELGPVPFDIKDEVYERFRNASNKVYAIVNEHYEERRGILRENLKQKIALCEELNTFIEQNDATDNEQWKAQTDKVIAFQNQWKTIGFSEDNETIWGVFRGLCDKFFDQKRAFFDNIDDSRKENAVQKTRLCAEAEKVKDSKEWKKTTEFLIDLQKQWKEIGPAPYSQENNLWKRFRAACDYFFDTKKKHFEEMDVIFKENLEKKEALIEEVRTYELTGAGDFEKLKDFSQRWGEIGFVPMKVKDTIYQQFQQALDGKYESLREMRQEVQSTAARERVEKIMSQSGDETQTALNKERSQINQQIASLEQNIQQYENNLGFFNGSDNPLRKMAEENLRKARTELSSLRQQLKAINNA
ncbi:MAG: DUF349 domain-containing protein [Bacteroidetes bacterium]|nr:DUF349 domain-containing protein [Bacteroidota bacterium]